VQSAVCADVARCGSGMSGMWPRGSRTLVQMTMGNGSYIYLYNPLMNQGMCIYPENFRKYTHSLI